MRSGSSNDVMSASYLKLCLYIYIYVNVVVSHARLYDSTRVYKTGQAENST